MVGTVWVCLHTEIQSGWFASSSRRRRKKETRNINSGRSRRRSASAENQGRLTSLTKKDQGVDLHLQRIKESFFFIDRRRKGVLGDQQRRIQEKICIGGVSRKDQLIDEKESRSGYSSVEDPGELLHRQTDELKEWLETG